MWAIAVRPVGRYRGQHRSRVEIGLGSIASETKVAAAPVGRVEIPTDTTQLTRKPPRRQRTKLQHFYSLRYRGL
jgi:hypothetical protein